jgi:dUTP pyrophosphatase
VSSAGGKRLVPTDLAIKLPDETYGRIAPRSGLACKNFIDVGAGVVDADYRGNVHVLLFNHGEMDFVIVKGDRIAQLIVEKILMPSVSQVLVLDESSRGGKGFGSTGL